MLDTIAFPELSVPAVAGGPFEFVGAKNGTDGGFEGGIGIDIGAGGIDGARGIDGATVGGGFDGGVGTETTGGGSDGATGGWLGIGAPREAFCVGAFVGGFC
jgi:hypothetical protein